MLKILESFPKKNIANAKCGEIFCQSSCDFTIICTFCDMKSFEFDDFLMHFRNVHLERSSFSKDKPLDVECEPIVEINIKSEDAYNEIDVLEEDSNHNSNIDDNSLTNAQKPIDQQSYDRWSDHEDSSEGDDFDNDDDDDDEWQPACDKAKDDSKTSKKLISGKLEKLYTCDLCPKKYKTEAMLRQHVHKFHLEKDLGPNIHKCDQCSEEFPLVHILNAHVVQQHLGFKCTLCDRRYKKKAKLRQHEIRHTGVRNFTCDFENCGKQFFFRTDLTKHKRHHTEPAKYICETCGYTCHIKESLVVHKRSHTGEKPFACKLCDKSFRSSSLLKEHQPIHSTERPHICHVCGAAFSRPKALYHHKHLHLGIKKFKCKLCGNAYAQAAGLAGHMRHHKANMA